MTKRFITLLLLFGTSLQTLLPGPAFLGSTEWPILLGLILCIALRTDRPGALYAGGLAGLLHDAFSPAPLGVSIPFFILIALGVHAVREEVFSDQIITYFVLGLLGGLSKALYFIFIFSVFGLRPVGAGVIAVHLWGSALLGVLTAPLLFLLLSARLRRQARKRRQMAW